MFSINVHAAVKYFLASVNGTFVFVAALCQVKQQPANASSHCVCVVCVFSLALIWFIPVLLVVVRNKTAPTYTHTYNSA